MFPSTCVEGGGGSFQLECSDSAVTVYNCTEDTSCGGTCTEADTFSLTCTQHDDDDDFAYYKSFCGTKSPVPAPSNLPTLQPTMSDTVSVEVSLEMTASTAPTEDDKASLKASVASILGVEEGTLKSFTVTSNIVSRRFRRNLLAAYTWNVGFTVTLSLSEIESSSAAAFADDIQLALTSTAFVSAVFSSVGATVNTSSVSTAAVERSSSSPDTDKSNATLVLILVVLGGLAVGMCCLAYRQRSSDGTVSNFIELAHAHKPLAVAVEEGSAIQFLLKAKFTNERAAFVAALFAKDGYELAEDFKGMTEAELSDTFLLNIGLAMVDIRRFRSAIAQASQKAPPGINVEVKKVTL